VRLLEKKTSPQIRIPRLLTAAKAQTDSASSVLFVTTRPAILEKNNACCASQLVEADEKLGRSVKGNHQGHKQASKAAKRVKKTLQPASKQGVAYHFLSMLFFFFFFGVLPSASALLRFFFFPSCASSSTAVAAPTDAACIPSLQISSLQDPQRHCLH
jgi:hypothetical protein